MHNQTFSDRLEKPANHPAVAELAAWLLHASITAADGTGFLAAALPRVAQTVGGEYWAIVECAKGQWKTIMASGSSRPLPEDLLSDVLDQEQVTLRGDWYVAPLQLDPSSGELLAAYRSQCAADDRNLLEAASRWLATALSHVRQRERDGQRLNRQAALLEMAAQWAQTHEMEKLLLQMAEASTRLLHAERASIFLWDRTTKTLIGRPALGVPKGELRIPDDAGVVGQVIQSGEPRRVDADIAAEQREIDRRVDQRLKFQTRSLLCVPLRGQRGELLGAFEVLNKIGGNFSDDDEQTLTELARHAAAALENTQQRERLVSAQKQVADQAEQKVRLIGESPAIAALRSAISRVANTDLSALITGENGTGKEVAAQLIHYQSRRRNEPLVAVNCAALPETLLESELFGHEKGAFTDARETRRGKFELAASGTLFLDEIGDMSLAGQAKLLRVLEEKIIVRVGGSTPIATNTRVIAATNQSLTELVRARRFREDLFFRLNVVTLEMPPLRERGDDVVLLAEHFLGVFSAQARRRTPKLTAAAKKRLSSHPWPGNVRELRNLMERLVYLSPDDVDKIDAPDLEFIMSPDAGPGPLSLDLPLADATREFQVQYIKRHIDRQRGNMSATAEKLGLPRSNLYRKMKQLGVQFKGKD
jgi:transcriptional regulator with GAF, ATPase, and Fis domain